MIVTQEIVDRFLSDPYLDAGRRRAHRQRDERAARAGPRPRGARPDPRGAAAAFRRSARDRRYPDTPERLHRSAAGSTGRCCGSDSTSRLGLRRTGSCEALGERAAGRRIALLGGTGAANNLAAVIALMNRAVNDHLGIESNERRDQNTEALERAIADLDDIADTVQQDLATRLSDANV